MTRAAILVPLLLTAASLALACGADAPAPTKVAEPEIDAGASPVAAVAEDGVPEITADAAVFEFGAIEAKESIEHVFTIRNTGTADLEIERVQRT